MALVKPHIPGFQDGGTAVEPTTGNDVPVGSLPNEVADDIPAKLSEGEFILPADVVRFIGLERLMKMRDEAKEGLRRMAEIGQMGNAEAVGEKADDSFGDDSRFESDIDSIMSEVDNEASTNAQTERMMAVGGYMSGTDISRASKNPVIDVRFLRHTDGRVMYITYIGGRPMTPIPEGFKEVTREEAIKSASEADASKKAAEEAKKTGSGGVVDTGGPGTGDGGSPAGGGGADLDAIAKGDLSSLATGTTVSPTAVKGAGVVGTILNIPGAPALVSGKTSQNIAAGITNLSGSLAGQQNITDVGKAFGIDTSTQEGKDQVSSLMQQMSENDVTGVPGGTSVQSDAMAAGTAASQAVSAAGGSTQDAAAAQQDAVNAVISGQDPAAATQAAVDAAIGLSYGGPAAGSISAGDTVGYGGAGDVSTSAGVDTVGYGGAGDVSVGVDGGGGGGGGGDGGCFLTTAAVEHMNEKDDGEVLSTLREFRDTYMKRNKEASKDVKWYYENAPKIVKELDDLPDAKMVYKRMYNQFIKPAYKAIKAGDDEKAYDIYKKGIKYAKEKADVDNVKPRYTNKKGLASR